MGKKIIDLEGQKIGNFIVHERIGSKRKQALWKCECICGKFKEYTKQEIYNNTTCGCIKGGRRRDDSIIGTEFTYLTVISYSHSDSKSRKTFYLCECKCGNKKIVSKSALRSKNTKSCGCLLNPVGENNSHWIGYKEISGLLWKRIERGAKERNLDFTITMEEAWELFIQQDRKCKLSGKSLILKQRHGHKTANASLDRIDSSKGYITGNIQWIDKDINMMKRNFSEEYFLQLCKDIVEFKKSI